MKLWHVSDTHLSVGPGGYGCIKNMLKFGPIWDNWMGKIKDFWDTYVKKEDFVLIGGDIFWPQSTEKDSLTWIKERPGSKGFIEGNHDKFVFRAIGKANIHDFKKQMLEEYDLIYLDEFLKINEIGILAQKLYDLPTQTFYSKYPTNEGKFTNEYFHLRNKIDQYKNEMLECKYRIFLSHYAPMDNLMDFAGSDWIKLLMPIQPTHCLFGHYHGQEVKTFMPNTHMVWNGIQFMNTSIDLNNMEMRLVI